MLTILRTGPYKVRKCISIVVSTGSYICRYHELGRVVSRSAQESRPRDNDSNK